MNHLPRLEIAGLLEINGIHLLGLWTPFKLQWIDFLIDFLRGANLFFSDISSEFKVNRQE
ncbi:hypothetical protein [Algoriphagus confluentis]|uniref:hypothetical protein n=1 Tax=Algoriphagus confluentis TaxID=1697556 RepID=UPI0030C6DBB7